MSLAAYQNTFQFTTNDQAANRQGQLSSRQRRRRLRGMVLSFLLYGSIIAFVLVALLVQTTLDRTFFITWLGTVTLLALLTVATRWSLLRDLLQGRVAEVEGSYSGVAHSRRNILVFLLRSSYYGQADKYRQIKITVGNKRLRITGSQYNLLKNAQSALVYYYLPRTGLVVATDDTDHSIPDLTDDEHPTLPLPALTPALWERLAELAAAPLRFDTQGRDRAGLTSAEEVIQDECGKLVQWSYVKWRHWGPGNRFKIYSITESGRAALAAYESSVKKKSSAP